MINILDGELQNIIDNVKKVGSNSTDIHSSNLHLSISIDNNKFLSANSLNAKKNEKKVIPKRNFFFNTRINKKQKAVAVPKIEILKENDNLKYIIVTKKGEIVAIHKNKDDNINAKNEQNKTDFIFLQNRFNSMDNEPRNFLSYLSSSIGKWSDKERTIFFSLISSLCENPKRTQNFFHTINKHYCPSCYKICVKRHKCIHFDCLGMCSECIRNVLTLDKCPSCKKPQIIQCPICLDKWSVRSCEILNCGHGICYKCLNSSWTQMGKGITQCPTCRSKQ